MITYAIVNESLSPYIYYDRLSDTWNKNFIIPCRFSSEEIMRRLNKEGRHGLKILYKAT